MVEIRIVCMNLEVGHQSKMAERGAGNMNIQFKSYSKDTPLQQYTPEWK
jgi:hypothetical protein